MWEPCFVYIYIHEIEFHNNGNVSIKSCWFIIWTCTTFIWPPFNFNIQIWNKQFSFLFYILLLNNHLSSFEMGQNNIAHLNQCLLLNTKKTQQCHIQKWNPSFLFDLHQSMVTNEHQYVTKMTLSARMGGLWGDFTTIFWITKYLQRPIYIWKKYQNTLCFDVAWILNLSLYI